MIKTISLLFIMLLSTRIVAGELYIEAELINISRNNPQCGLLHVGSVAEYADIKIIRGDFNENKIFIVHGCIELLQKEYLISNKKYGLLLTSKKPNHITIFPTKTGKEYGHKLYYSKKVNILK